MTKTVPPSDEHLPATTFAGRITQFYFTFPEPALLPNDVQVLNPYRDAAVQSVVNRFFGQYFADTRKRIAILGINPGRFGGGVTGISFTDPVALREHCGISHTFPERAELSSRYVYTCINRFGGAAEFYKHFFISSLYPLALVRDGKNYNFYDNPQLYKTLEPSIISSLQTQRQAGLESRVAVCLGKKNADYLHRLNDRHRFFDTIHILDHPRFIMQYRLKHVESYVDKWMQVLHSVIDSR
jgi:hypothetical protein